MKRALIAAGIVLFWLCNFSNSYSDDDFTFETYTVKAGDTFQEISRYYREKDSRNIYIFDYQDELKRLNSKLTENGCQINPGDKIIIHYVEKIARQTDTI